MDIKINLEDQFEHLSNPPIAEAVFEVRARVGVPWARDDFLPVLIKAVPDYTKITAEHGIENRVDTGSDDGGEIKVSSDIGVVWQGLNAESTLKPQSVRFARDLFSFSRLSPYEDFDKFSNEGLRLLQIFKDTTLPGDIQRIALRFVNRIEIPPKTRLRHILTAPPREKSGLKLPLAAFFHNDTLTVPGHPYAVSVIRTIQSYPETQNRRPAVILDLTVFTINSLPFALDSVRLHLQNMRWLKNKLFFGNITPGMIKTFK